MNKTLLILSLSGFALLAGSSCKQRTDATANEAQPDSLSIARKAADEQTLTILKDKKETAEQQAVAAKAKLNKAEEDEDDASDAAKQADRAYKTEEAAQKARNEANDQSAKSEKATDKSQQD